jgi:hypothetical protein
MDKLAGIVRKDRKAAVEAVLWERAREYARQHGGSPLEQILCAKHIYHGFQHDYRKKPNYREFIDALTAVHLLDQVETRPDNVTAQ